MVVTVHTAKPIVFKKTKTSDSFYGVSSFLVALANLTLITPQKYWSLKSMQTYISIWHYGDVIVGVSNHQPHDCLLNRLFRRRSNKTSNLPVTGLCAGNSPGSGEFPAQTTCNAENVSIWWRHHETTLDMYDRAEIGRVHKGTRTNKNCG